MLTSGHDGQGAMPEDALAAQPDAVPGPASADGQNVDLFGEPIDDFKSAKERYGTWPVTVWDCDLSDPTVRKMKDAIGDICSSRAGTGKLGYQSKSRGSARAGCLREATDDASVYGGKITESIFNPAVAAWILNLYAPRTKDAICYDPFAGGGTRAIMAAKHGIKYMGVEIRQAEVDAVEQRCKALGVDKQVGIICGDSRTATKDLEGGFADFLLTCPPYYDLETYDGGPNDLSMAHTYAEFVAGLKDVVEESARVLRPGAFSCWVVGLHRNDAGEILAMHHDLARLHQEAGFRFKEEVILHQRNNGAIQRVGQFEKGDKRLVRIHEYLLVFVRGIE